jgi:mono/diheme cytochrome c family protein
MLEGVLSVISLTTLAGLMIYGLNAWIMVWLHLRHRAVVRPAGATPDPLPTVTVQLPLFNERYVAERLLEAVGALDYPADRLEIQVLDDSTDDTSDIVAAAVTRLRAGGLDVVHRRRDVRDGYKAGALAEGLATCRGELVAVFDADFVPPPDFLRRVVPHLAPDVAVVQARWGHLNRSFSTLTVAQALGMDGHFGVEQSARAWSGLLLNFNGTAGVWRKRAIIDAGGWQPDTLTEDLDLSYRAQLRGWRIVYRPEIVCPAELPVVVTGFKSQQRRWAKGSIQTARKLLPAVVRAPLPLWIKYQAFVHLTYYVIHPLMLANVALLLPLRLGGVVDGGEPMRLAAVVILAVTTLGPLTLLVYGQWALDPRWWRRAWQLPSILVLGVGVALSTSIAVVEGFFGKRREFVRTPKFGIERRTGSWRHKSYGERAATAGLVEMAVGAYCAIMAWAFWRDHAYGIAPFVSIYAAGFLAVGWLTIVHSAAVGASSDRWWDRILSVAASRGTTMCVVATVAVWAGSAAADPWIRLVEHGERLWITSPDPTNPVACATCHHDADEVSRWAPSFPKFKPGPPLDARVMTLWQANVDAVARHYRHTAPPETATAITAYLTSRGAGRPITPGIIPGHPVFESRMRRLAESVARGAQLFASHCALCHTLDAVAAAAGDLERQLRVHDVPLETFLARHETRKGRRGWDAAAVADVMAYLVDRRAGRALGSVSGIHDQEARR